MGQESFFIDPYQEKGNIQRIASDTAQATVEKGLLCSLSGQRFSVTNCPWSTYSYCVDKLMINMT